MFYVPIGRGAKKRALIGSGKEYKKKAEEKKKKNLREKKKMMMHE